MIFCPMSRVLGPRHGQTDNPRVTSSR
jgi:hypothetical protein